MYGELVEMISIKSKKTAFCSTIILSAIYVLSLFLLPIANGAEESELIESPDSKPYGLSYGEWSVKWWQWVLSIPADKSPIIDKSGAYCATNQNNSNAWFLVGSGGGEVVRTCTIPAGKAIFFPIINVECSYAEDSSAKTEQDLRNCAREDQNKVTYLRVTIDGVNIQNLTKYRTDSPLFNFTTPEKGLFDLKSVSTQGVSDGYFVMLKPPSPGSHELIFSGVYGDPTVAGSQILIEKATYHLTIE